MIRLCPDISICICTYNRPNMLLRLLKELKNQRTDGKFTYSVVIVDNDYKQSARKIVDFMKSKCSFSIDYYAEPIQNISLARNMAIQNAQGDFIAFIDDDEFPTSAWLFNHYNFLCRSTADGSLGPVLPYYEIEPPSWVLKGKFFNRPSYRTGSVLRWNETRTGNVLLKRDLFSSNEIAFDPKFGGGGEDKDFFRRKIKQNRQFAWCEEASVYESIPELRWTRSFMLRRALHRGKADAHSTSQDVMSISKSLAAIIVDTLALPISLFFGYHIFRWTLIRDCYHLGKIAALCRIDIIKEKYV